MQISKSKARFHFGILSLKRKHSEIRSAAGLARGSACSCKLHPVNAGGLGATGELYEGIRECLTCTRHPVILNIPGPVRLFRISGGGGGEDIERNR